MLQFLPHNLSAQNSLFLNIESDVKVEQNKIDNLNKKYQDRKAADLALKNLQSEMQDLGYFAFSVDSLQFKNDTLNALIHIGEKYKGIKLNYAALPESIQKIYKPVKQKEFINVPQWQSLNTKALQYAQNNGRPFASIQLENIEIDNNEIAGDIQFIEGRKVVIDSIQLRGNAKVNDRFIQNYIGIEKGDIYNESKIAKVNQRLKELAFLDVQRSPAVEFYRKGARLFLFAKKKKASKFDFLLGVLPNDNLNGRRFDITGEGLLTLMNTLGYGERFHVEYKSYPQSSRAFQLEASSTYLPSLPFGADVNFNLFIRDTSFLDRKLGFGLIYPLEGNSYAKAYYQFNQSTLLGFNENQIIQNKELPNNIDWTNNVYGLSLHYEKLNYRFNPTKGFSLSTKVGIGNKKIIRNIQITELVDPNDETFNFTTLYDSLPESSIKLNSQFIIDKYWNINSSSVIKTSLNTAYIFNNQLFENELHRIGGYKLLRGFDEQSIFANWYNVFTIEYRYLIGTNSFFSAFYDMAYIERNTIQQIDSDWPIGFGVGLNFETNAGIFGLNYALGRQMNNPINLRTGKVHFGYINFF